MEVPFSHMTTTVHERNNSLAKKQSSLLSNKFKRPFRKRHSSLSHSSFNQVNKIFAKAIEARSMDVEKSNQVAPVTLCFKNKQREKEYYQEEDVGFVNSILCSLFLLFFVASVQALVLPWTQLLLFLFLAAFVIISIILIIILASRLRMTTWDPSQKFGFRLCLSIVAILAVYIVAQVNAFTCEVGKSPCKFNVTNIVSNLSPEDFAKVRMWCPLPEYIPLSCVLGFLAVAIFLKLPFLVKAVLLTAHASVYAFLIFYTQKNLFTCFDERMGVFVPSQALGVVYIIFFLFAVLVHGRQVEWTMRLDFLWQCQAADEKEEMVNLQETNRRILFNLLPAHVATHFLDNQLHSNMNLYHQSYNRIGVLFASIPNYHEFYTELDVNNQGKECLRLLNEIISDFDQLLDEERFKSVDKIKTVGSAYMAAVGLMPEMRIKDNDDDSAGFYMSTLVELAFAFREKLGVINADSYNNFSLKVGLNIGPVVAGVIGARKPQYDIWGNTVNVASRMESTGLINHIQVTEDVYNVLKNFPYEFQCRGKIKVKGKGDMTTYFITDRKPITSDISSVPPQIPPHKQPLGNICGGVPTPLSYLPSKNSLQSHSFARPTNLQELNLQISSSREASRNCKVHCYPDQGLCSEPKKVMNKVSHKCLQSNEQEPLLQSVGNSIASACHQPRKERIEVPFSCSDSLQMQHQILSSHCERQHRNAPPSRNNNICCQPKSKALPPDLNFDLEPYWQKHECFHENIKEPIYRGIRAKELKCLDRRKHLNNPLYKGMPNTGKGLVLPQFPQYPHVEEAGIRHKLRNFTRHHSDESLHGSSHKEIYSSRIHSSFDELSSANRSPSLSSSDESFSRTDFSRTDQDSPSPQNTPSLYEEQMKYLCNDSDLLENLGINFKDAFFPDDINKRSSDETSLCLNNLNSMIFTPSWKDAKENNRDNLQKMRRDDVFIPKFSPYIIQDRSKKNKVKSESESKTLPESRHGHNVVSHLKTEVGPRHSLAEEKITSVTSGSESFSRIQSLDKSSRESGMVTPESVIMMPRKRSLTREDYLSNSSRKYSSSQKSLGERLNVESDYDNEPQSLGKVSPKKEWLELEKISDSSQDIKKNKIGSLDRLETKSNSLSGDEKSLEGYNSLQKLIKLQEKHLSIVDECSEKLGLHFDPSKNHKILQLKPISTTVSELPGNKESQNIHPMKDKQEYNLPEEESEFNEKLKNKHEVEKTKNNFECEAEDGASLMPYSDHPLTDEEDIRTFEEVEQRLADESKEKIKISSKERNFESKKETDGNETSQSEWSEDDDGAASEPLLDRESTGGYTTDDAALEQVSVMNEAGLTDAEGALSDVNSLYNDPQHYDGDMDDTSMSSRASSHIFDNDALITFDSLNAYCDSELDVRHFGAPVPDGFDTEALSDVDLDSSIDPFANMSDMRNIRSVSASITKNFGQPRPDTDDGESDV